MEPQSFARCLGVSLTREALEEVAERGQPVRDENSLLLMNAHHQETPFVLPTPQSNAGWFALLDTSCRPRGIRKHFIPVAAHIPLQASSLALLAECSPNGIRAQTGDVPEARELQT